jgi:predicted RNA binding protein YcfA (HicA-like mRNA interferase family)
LQLHAALGVFRLEPLWSIVNLGCHERVRRGGGSHRKWFNPASQRTAAIPDWGSRDIKLGTLRAAVRQMAIEWRDFERA